VFAKISAPFLGVVTHTYLLYMHKRENASSRTRAFRHNYAFERSGSLSLRARVRRARHFAPATRLIARQPAAQRERYAPILKSLATVVACACAPNYSALAAGPNVPLCDSHVRVIDAPLADINPPHTEYLPHGAADLLVIVLPNGKVKHVAIASWQVSIDDNYLRNYVIHVVEKWRLSTASSTCIETVKVTFKQRE